jgi:hypothetical protein
VQKSVPATKHVTFQEDRRTFAHSHDDDLIMRVNLDVNCLLDTQADVRYDALLSLHCAFLGDFPGEVRIKTYLTELCPFQVPVQIHLQKTEALKEEAKCRRRKELKA